MDEIANTPQEQIDAKPGSVTQGIGGISDDNAAVIDEIGKLFDAAKSNTSEAPSQDSKEPADTSARSARAEKRKARADALRAERDALLGVTQERQAENSATPKEPTATTPAETPLPSSWSKSLSDEWATLPEKIRAEIAKREADTAKGFEKYQHVSPIIDFVVPIAQASGKPPAAILRDWAETYAALSNPETRVQAFSALKQLYPHEAAQAAKVENAETENEAETADDDKWSDPDLKALKEEIAELKKVVNGVDAYRRQNELASRQQFINDFAVEKDGELLKRPYFNDPAIQRVLPELVQMLVRTNPTSSHADILQAAYTAAVASNPEIRAREAQERYAQIEREREEKARRARQAAVRAVVSPRTTTPPVSAPKQKSMMEIMDEFGWPG